MLSPITERQFKRLFERYHDANLESLPSGAGLVTLPNFELPSGWNTKTTDVRFLIPVGYPGPFPDCFWTSRGLRLANGQMPQNAQEEHQIPETSHRLLWFSWHITDAAKNWNPSRDDLLTYAKIIAVRFEKLQ